MINTISKIIQKAWVPILVIILLFIMLFITLSYGIKIDSLSLPNVKIERLYIKLDKKLFVEAKSIHFFKSSNQNSSMQSMDYILNEIPFTLQFFDTIIVNELVYNDIKAKVILKDDSLFVDNNFLVFDAKLTSYKDKNISLHVNNVLLKEYNISVSGEFAGDINKNKYTFVGNFKVPGIDGNVSLKYSDDLLHYSLNSNNFNSLAPFMESFQTYVKFDEEIARWIYKDIVASSYNLQAFSGKMNIKQGKFFPLEMRGVASAKDVAVTFYKDVPPAHIKDLTIELIKNQLVFTPKNVTYENSSLHSADVVIYNLIDGHSGIKIDMNSSSYLDDGIHKILKAFKINFPVSQLSGNNDLFLGLDIKFSPFSAKVLGNFNITNADINVSSTKMFLQKANIELNNSIINFKNSTLEFDTIFSATMQQGTIDMSKKVLESDLYINFVRAKNIINIENITTPFRFEIINRDIFLNFEEFESKIHISKNLNMSFSNLSKLSKYAPLMRENKIKDGSLNVTTDDFKKFAGVVNITKAELPLIKNNKTITAITANFIASNKEIIIKSNDEKIRLVFDNKADLYFEDLSVIYDLNSINEDSAKMLINLELNNGTVILTPSNRVVLADKLLLKQEADFLSLHVKHRDSTLDLVQGKENLTVDAKSLNSDFANAILGKEFFNKGELDVVLHGENQRNFQGSISIKDTKLKDFAALNNLAAFFNTIPALATLNNPKYSSSGYPVKSGRVDLARIENLIYISQIDLMGYSADLSGTGYIDIDKDEIYLELKISTLKAISEIIDYIPLVNFIVLGDDGNITISVSVRGKLSDPKVYTSVFAETVMSPLNIIKRIFLLPIRILE